MDHNLYLREDGQNYKLRLEVEESLRQLPIKCNYQIKP